jgi:hypothetical protein
MRIGLAVWPLATEILMDCTTFMLAAMNCSLIHFFKLKYYGTFTHITQFVCSNAHVYPLKGGFSDKPLMIEHRGLWCMNAAGPLIC